MDRFVKAGLRAARWFAQSQVTVQGPYWDANFGRFIYNRHLPSGATVPALSWTQGRGIFMLLAGWELSRDASLLVPVVRAAEYIKLLQIYDSPRDLRRQFAIRENMPMHWWSHVRDATEAALGMLFVYRISKDEQYLRRAVDFAQWFERNGWDRNGWPARTVWLDRHKTAHQSDSFQAGNGPFFYYLAKATGQRQYLQSLKRISDLTMKRYLRQDGAIVTGHIDLHHTTGQGVVTNDDGLMICLLCAYSAFKDPKYLDAVQRYGQWVLANIHEMPTAFSALPCMCNSMIELAAITGESRYRDWAQTMLRRHVLPLQVRNARDPMSDGAFRGEDEPVAYYGPKSSATPATDFITTRVTCYAGLACLKLAGIVGPYYGPGGWDRPFPKTRLPALAID